jgi:type I restriction enzyme S subunit
MTIALAAAGDVSTNAQRGARLRQSILKWAFEGRLVDQDPTDEPASVLLERIRAERAAAATQQPKRAARRNARSSHA